MKILALVAVFAIFATFVLATQPNQPSGNSNPGPNPKCPPSITCENNYITNNEAEHPNPNPPKWYAAFKQPDGMLVIVGFLTLVTIWWQAKEMRRATKAMKEQTDIQRAGMRQWLDIGEWGVSHSPDLHYSTGQGQLRKCPEAIILEIYFKVINSTERPLTVTNIRTNVLIVGRESANTFTVSEKSIVAPKGGKFPNMISIALEGEEFDRYILSTLVLKITTYVSFQDSMRESNAQTFEQDIECSVKGGFALDKPVKRAEKEISTENDT